MSEALRGRPLIEFTVEERFLWAKHRKSKTKSEEDQAYSILGIFNICMPLLYGERKEKALRHLREEIGRMSNCKYPWGFCATYVNIVLSSS